MTNLYERIKKQTDNMDISGKELGELLGLKKSPLTDWKNGKSKPTLEQFEKMCEIFAVSAEWLLLGKEQNELTADEQELINCYRRADNRGKRNIMRQAELESEEQESSTSKIG